MLAYINCTNNGFHYGILYVKTCCKLYKFEPKRSIFSLIIRSHNFGIISFITKLSLAKSHFNNLNQIYSNTKRMPIHSYTQFRRNGSRCYIGLFITPGVMGPYYGDSKNINNLPLTLLQKIKNKENIPLT